jgi:hypothetical protein
VQFNFAAANGKLPSDRADAFISIASSGRSKLHMAKRMMTRFDRGAFPTYETVEENGYPQPTVMGQPWVNPDTQKTIRKRGGRKTDAYGRPIEPKAPNAR